jgi:hypothetical protein
MVAIELSFCVYHGRHSLGRLSMDQCPSVVVVNVVGWVDEGDYLRYFQKMPLWSLSIFKPPVYHL